MKKEMLRYAVAALAIFALSAFRSAPARAADPYSGLMINLYVSDQRILVYAGMDRGIFTGQRFNVFRDGMNIGTIQITEVRTASSIAKTVTKTVNFRDMDLLAPADGSSVAPPERSPQYKPSEGSGRLSGSSGGMIRTSPSGMKEMPTTAPSGAETAQSDSSKKEKINDAAGSDSGTKKTASDSKDSKKTASADKEKSSDKKTSSTTDKKETAKSADKKETAKTDDKAADKPASKRSSRSSAAKKDSEKEEAAPAEDAKKTDAAAGGDSAPKSSSKRGSSRKPSGGDSEKSADDEAAKAEKAPEKPKTPTDPRAFAFPTNNGFSGLWTVPTTDVIAKRHFAFSYYSGWYGNSFRVVNIYPDVATKTYIGSVKIRTGEYAFTYGLARNVELSYSAVRATADFRLNDDKGWLTMNGHTVGVKYNHGGRRKFLEPTTAKKWTTAIGAMYTDIGDSDASYVYGMANLPYPKFDVHAGLFFYDYNGMQGKRWGTMGGVEVPLTNRSLLIGEGTLFQSKYVYNVAVKYIYKDRGSVLLGLGDLTDTRIKQLGLSVLY